MQVLTPYRTDKDLGLAYNQSISCLPDDWICVKDYDVCLPLPNTLAYIIEYTLRFPDTGIFTCYTNRLHPLAKNQLLNGVDDDFNYLSHYNKALRQTEKLFEVTELNKHISGFLMVFHKSTWNEIKFPEGIGCLGVDNYFSDRVLKSGRKILRMNGVYVFHAYRPNGIKDKSHLI